MNISIKKGFTLIELLIVIGIIAILATAVLVVLNPGQILAEARDSQRLTDLDTMKQALSLTAFASSGMAFNATAGCGANITMSNFNGGAACAAGATPRAIDNTGWVKICLTNGCIGSGGSSTIAVLPQDPSNTASSTYLFTASAANAIGANYQLAARLESVKQRTKMTNDGGSADTCGGSFNEHTCWYETGTDLSLNP